MKIYTPLRAIRKNCIQCSGDNVAEVRLCTVEECPLFPWRFGKRPSTVIKDAKKKLATSL
jgi:hypothetical protein